ncbi:MAG: GNAT family N-acetyltransferase [Rubrivivax sp.]
MIVASLEEVAPVSSPSHGAGALQAALLTSGDELRRLEPDWRELFRRIDCPSPFLSFDWLNTWWENFGADLRLYVIAVRDREQRLVALAPLCLAANAKGLLRGRRLGFLGPGPSDRLDLLVDAARLAPAVHAIADLLVERSREWDCIELTECDENSASLIELRDTLRKRGFSEQIAAGSVCPYVALPPTFDDYLQELGPNLRRNFRRRLKALQRHGKVEFLACSDIDNVRTGFEELIALHGLRFSQKGEASGFLERELPFHRAILRTPLGSDRARLFALRLDGRAIGTWYGFSLGSVFYSYQSGMDPKWSHLSVGLVTLGSTIEAAIGQGHREVDFLRGDEEYKFQWTSRSRRNLNVLLFSQRPRSQAARLGAAVQSRARSIEKKLRGLAKAALVRMGLRSEKRGRTSEGEQAQEH